MFGDDLTISNIPVTKQLIDTYNKEEAIAVLGVQKVQKNEVHKYGTVRYKKNSSSLHEVEEACEKFPAEEAPSLMAVFGRFVFSYKVIEKALKSSVGKDNELWVIDILNSLAKEGEKIIAQPVEGEWCTTGDPLSYLKTSFKFAQKREDIKKELTSYLRKNIKN